MNRLLTRLGLVFGVVLIVVLGLLLALLPGRSEPRAASVLSGESDGLRALYLSAEALGFSVATWSSAPGELDALGARELLVLSALPPEPPPLPRALAADAPPRARAREHYRSFVARGGALLVLGADLELAAFLRDEVDFGAARWRRVEESSASEAGARAALERGEVLELAHSPRVRLEPGPDDRVLARDAEGEALGLVRVVGAGRVAWLALGPSELANDALRADAAPLVLFVRMLEALAPLEGVRFDEYALGAWRPTSVTALAFSERLGAFSVNALALVLALVLRLAWSGPFARDPAPARAVAPLLRARGLAHLFARAGHFELLAERLREGLLARCEAQSGRRGETRARAERLTALARSDAERAARLAAAFARRPRDAAQLESLARELDQLERELLPPSPPRARHVPKSTNSAAP